MQRLPLEVQLEIISYLTPIQRLVLSRVCKSLRLAVFDGIFWREIELSDHSPLNETYSPLSPIHSYSLNHNLPLSPVILMNWLKKGDLQWHCTRKFVCHWLIAAPNGNMQESRQSLKYFMQSQHESLVYLVLHQLGSEQDETDDALLLELPIHCRYLDLSYTKFTGAHLVQLFRRNLPLTFLNLGFMNKLDNASHLLTILVLAGNSLSHLQLTACRAVNDSTLACISHSCPQLQHLLINMCHVSDQGLAMLTDHGNAELCHSLKYLNVKSCVPLTYQACVRFLEEAVVCEHVLLPTGERKSRPIIVNDTKSK